MRILVTGAGGLLGRTLLNIDPTCARGHEWHGVTHEELDVTDSVAVSRQVEEFSPNCVLHCAAYTDVDGAERDPARAMDVNAAGSELVAAATRRVGARMVYVSTDYVFDGEHDSPYSEMEDTNPISSYGRSKLEGEKRVAQACPEAYLIVRTAWTFGAGGGFVDWARDRLVAGEELALITDQRGSPTSALDLARAMLLLVENEHRGLFHFANRGTASWFEVGKVVAETLAVDSPRLRPIKSSELGRPAPRPRCSALSPRRFEQVSGRRVADWRQAVNSYLRSPRLGPENAA